MACKLYILIDTVYFFHLAAAGVPIATDTSSLTRSGSSGGYGDGNNTTGGDGVGSYYFLDGRRSTKEKGGMPPPGVDVRGNRLDALVQFVVD